MLFVLVFFFSSSVYRVPVKVLRFSLYARTTIPVEHLKAWVMFGGTLSRWTISYFTARNDDKDVEFEGRGVERFVLLYNLADN